MSRYDYDVVVIGAGPAGLAAATRVRWVKGYHVLASSVCVVDCGPPGGLLSWGSCILTGPGWAYPGKELADRLLVDIERLQIPQLNGRVTSIERTDGLLITRLSGGRQLSSHAVILCTGFRPVGNEADYYLRGVRITFKGYDHFPSLVQACARDAQGRGLVVVGNKKTAHLTEVLESHSAGAGPIRLLTDGEPITVLGKERVEAVRLHSGEVVDCGAVLMDYNAFELTPHLSISGLAPRLDDRGFVQVNARMETSEPGLFAAGDITGRYASTLMALGDGVCAGFGAYVHAFNAKFGQAPKLFAYAATDERLPAEPRDLPAVPDSAIPVALGPGAPDWVDGQTPFGRLDEAQRKALEPATLSKDLTYHHHVAKTS